MDLTTQSEVILRDAGYSTWVLPQEWPAIGFENGVIIGFLFTFPSATALLDGWHSMQLRILSQHAERLRSAGPKAWNLYSVFVTADGSDTLRRSIERIDEDFSLARKIARLGVQSHEDLRLALLPLLPLGAWAPVPQSEYDSRLRSRLAHLPQDAVTAFLGPVGPGDVARILEDSL